MLEKQCPCCKGIGRIKIPKGKRINSCYEKSIEAKALRKAGLNYRQIQEKMGISTTSMVNYYLKKDW